MIIVARGLRVVCWLLIVALCLVFACVVCRVSSVVRCALFVVGRVLFVVAC